MRLIRTGVFETNSSSCHSMAYVARLQLDRPMAQTITQQFGFLGFTPMFADHVLEAQFQDYVWKERKLSTMEEKLCFLLTNIYSEMLLDEVFADEFYLQVKQWLQDIGITLQEPEYDLDDYIENVSDQGVVEQEMFKTADDLYKYLFDNNIVINIQHLEVEAEY